VQADDVPGEGSLKPRSLMHLFLVFSGLALRGFGGVLPWAQRVLVEERRWLSREQFIETLAFGQLLPGPNVCNVAIMVGDRWFGWRGAVAALGGMLAAPMLLVLGAAVLYGQVADEPVVRRAWAACWLRRCCWCWVRRSCTDKWPMSRWCVARWPAWARWQAA
jgi:chromate transporter